ncbi:hypothetical protein EDD86DRAFT_246883 [Gorgonomyces haynaldii]|nr:hypothetical protein EDD86DRAFT_246883 [Gorgonomyces haynaldii]
MTRIVLNEWQTQFGCAGPPDIIRSFTVSDTLEQPDGEYWPHLYVPGSVTCGMTLIYDNGCCTSLEDYPISDSYALSWMQVQASGTQWESASTLSNSFHYCMNDNSVLYLANGACLDQSVRCFPNQTLSLYDQDGCHNLLETHDLHSPVTSVYGAFEIYQPKESKALITYTEMPYKVMHFNTPLEVFSLVCFAISYLLLLYFIYQVIFTMRHARNGFRALQLSSYLIAFMCGIMKLYTHVESFQTDNPQEYLRFALIAAAELSLDKIATLLSAIATLNYILVPLVGSGWSFKRKLVLNLCLIVLHLILCAGSYTVWVENYLSVFEDPRYYQLIGFQNLVYPWDIYWRLFLDCGIPIYVAIRLLDDHLILGIQKLYKTQKSLLVLFLVEFIAAWLYFGIRVAGLYTLLLKNDLNQLSMFDGRV